MPDKFYAEIFAQNGNSYHQAMQTWPQARDQEFNTALASLNLAQGAHVLDVPAGGGYLQRYLSDSHHYHGFDFSGGFDAAHNIVENCSETKIDIADSNMDAALCLASLHHIENRSEFYQEVRRTLKPNGVFLIADVVAGSPQDGFLNTFVNQWNSLGHEGVFIDLERDQEALVNAGFSCDYSVQHYHWQFRSSAEALEYFRLLFTLDRQPSDALLTKAITQLGEKKTSAAYCVRWSLGFIKAVKR